MQVLSEQQVQKVSGALSNSEGLALVLGLTFAAPVGFAMGFGLAVAAGMLFIEATPQVSFY